MKKILIGICGGIAAYKSIEIARLLQKRGNTIRFVLTEAATEFVNPLTLQALSTNPVRSALFDPAAESAMSHIELARWADTLLICPATANTIAKCAHGIADNLLSTLYLATTAEIVFAPAMNRIMWQHPATQANINILRQRPHHRILPVAEGIQACGETGPGRLLEPQAIVDALNPVKQDMLGQRVVITAGPTREAIDPVRYLSNHSSGKMGYALARAASARGAKVTLISGPVSLSTPESVERIDITSALDMQHAVAQRAPNSDIFIGAAAVSDYRVNHPQSQKHKKTVHGALSLELSENPDIIAGVAAYPPEQRPLTIGFAAETEHVVEHARSKRQRKNLDMIIANDVSHGADDTGVFGSDNNRVTIITAHSEKTLPEADKATLADQILDEISHMMAAENTLDSAD